ncbi:2-amino-4-hydroxy-6-hydroxymethyldihydropteridine diphosphokinase [Stakelama marina]|uniref:2-amino-4-hydroxy-6-hydroxymethyldihydropteridine pyrophosphokinase n=1 Tax=Stakelama marina TaxID=2826939 RepID=A0A8T4IKA9_9SPHN|nr:2-amino-4-hydroxy-6-hydroxymethyldihydropteridine diphosphokinase [Stakelama marina]MBR0552626.1 2-amino-4-hydroxy-6-hydroxymethyldihydropteridine diphosphokinase [Stakelama marina]
MTTSYAIALGSNRRTRHGDPRATLRAAIERLEGVFAISPFVETDPVGPSRRRFANAVVLMNSEMSPPELLDRLKRLESDFGRRRGQRWGERTLDCDIILWSGGIWAEPGLTVPHALFRERGFVLDPLSAVAAGWRDPISGLSVRQLQHRRKRG